MRLMDAAKRSRPFPKIWATFWHLSSKFSPCHASLASCSNRIFIKIQCWICFASRSAGLLLLFAELKWCGRKVKLKYFNRPRMVQHPETLLAIMIEKHGWRGNHTLLWQSKTNSIMKQVDLNFTFEPSHGFNRRQYWYSNEFFIQWSLNY